ncbi:MAG TPA: ATP-binding protein [Yinghuangia sp.]|nr:ATP-binding protein [Yinghuangia sp.]
MSAAAVATATAAAVLGLAAALISVMTLISDDAKLHAAIVILLFVPSAAIGLASTFVQRRFVAEHIGRLHAEIARRDDAHRRLAEEVDRRGGEIAELNRSRQLLLAEDDLLRERMQESFVNLSMRTLTLVERQLDLIERLEHTEEDAQRLEDLFRLDHLATRMRRNSENVLVLANADERHGHRPPGTLLDVVRAAVSEIEYYERVDIGHIPRTELAGHTADDISHLLAELLENAAAYSPPSTRVTVAGRTLENRGILLTVEDEGFGVPPDRLPELNAQLLGGPAAAGAPDLAGLGVFVVGALAARHGVRVQLRPRREGGLAAIVMLPAALLHGSGPSPADITHERELDRAQAAVRDTSATGRLPGATTRTSLQARHENAPSATGRHRSVPADEAPAVGEVPFAGSGPGPQADVAPAEPAQTGGNHAERAQAGDSVTSWASSTDGPASSPPVPPSPSTAPGTVPGEPPPLPRRLSRAKGGTSGADLSAHSGADFGTDSSAGDAARHAPPAAAEPAYSVTPFAQDPDATALLRIAASLSSDMPADPSAGIRVSPADAARPPLPRRSRGDSAVADGSPPVSDAAAEHAPRQSSGNRAVTDAGLPKRVARDRADDGGAVFPGPSAGLLSGAAPTPGVRDSGPVAAEELRRRLSGFQMGCSAARQAPIEQDTPMAGLPALPDFPGISPASGPVTSPDGTGTGVPEGGFADETAGARGGETL